MGAQHETGREGGLVEFIVERAGDSQQALATPTIDLIQEWADDSCVSAPTQTTLLGWQGPLGT